MSANPIDPNQPPAGRSGGGASIATEPTPAPAPSPTSLSPTPTPTITSSLPDPEPQSSPNPATPIVPIPPSNLRPTGTLGDYRLETTISTNRPTLGSTVRVTTRYTRAGQAQANQPILFLIQINLRVFPQIAVVRTNDQGVAIYEFKVENTQVGDEGAADVSVAIGGDVLETRVTFLPQ